jgi:hypothetical protein
MPEANDPIVSALDSLRDDVDRAPLPGAGAARRRGDQRIRRQAIGGGLLAAVLLVGGADAVLANSDDSHTSLPPARHQTTAPVTPSPTEPVSSTLGDSVLLDAADLPVNAGAEGAWRVVAPTDLRGEQLTDHCLEPYDGAAFEQVLNARYEGPSHTHEGQAGVQWVYRAKTEQGARNVYADALAWIQGCPRRTDPTASRQPQLLAEVDWSAGTTQLHHWALGLEAPDRTDVAAVQEVALGQVGTTVSVLVLQDYAQDGGPSEFIRPAAERMMADLADAQGV